MGAMEHLPEPQALQTESPGVRSRRRWSFERNSLCGDIRLECVLHTVESPSPELAVGASL